MKPTVSVTHTSRSKSLQANLKKVGSRAVYVGIPSTTAAERIKQLTRMVSGHKVTSKKTRLTAVSASSNLNNAELLYVFSKGSPVHHQPPRPVIEPAIAADGNREGIAHELAESTKATLNGDQASATKFLKRAGFAGENAAKGWFFDSRNAWQGNAPRTIAAKGSDRPGIDTSAMIGAITSVIRDEN